MNRWPMRKYQTSRAPAMNRVFHCAAPKSPIGILNTSLAGAVTANFEQPVCAAVYSFIPVPRTVRLASFRAAFPLIPLRRSLSHAGFSPFSNVSTESSPSLCTHSSRSRVRARTQRATWPTHRNARLVVGVCETIDESGILRAACLSRSTSH